MKLSKKGKILFISSGVFVLILLVFLAGWFTVQMLDLSKGLDHVVGTGDPPVSNPDKPMKLAGAVVVKKMPPIPHPLPEPIILQKEPASPSAEQPMAPVEETDFTASEEAEPIPDAVLKHIAEATPEEVDTPKSVDLFSVQTGAFLQRKHAEKRALIVKKLGYTPYIFSASDSKNRHWHTVRIGDYESIESASIAFSEYQKKSIFPAVITHINSLSAVVRKKK
jgi:cell division septation protein DedD